jgi:hypothetical protein
MKLVLLLFLITMNHVCVQAHICEPLKRFFRCTDNLVVEVRTRNPFIHLLNQQPVLKVVHPLFPLSQSTFEDREMWLEVESREQNLSLDLEKQQLKFSQASTAWENERERFYLSQQSLKRELELKNNVLRVLAVIHVFLVLGLFSSISYFSPTSQAVLLWQSLVVSPPPRAKVNLAN